jgi:hypothetical protein
MIDSCGSSVGVRERSGLVQTVAGGRRTPAPTNEKSKIQLKEVGPFSPARR